MVYTILDLPTIRHLLLLLHHASSPLRLLHFIPAQNHPPTSPSPPAWRCSCPPLLDPSGKAVIDLRPWARVFAVPSCSSCLSVCVSQHTRITCTYSASGFWRVHPHPSPVFLTAVHRTVTYYSHVTCSVLDLPMSASLSTWSSFRGCPSDSDSAVASSSFISILDIVPPAFVLFAFYCTALVTIPDNGNVPDVYSVYLPNVDLSLSLQKPSSPRSPGPSPASPAGVVSQPSAIPAYLVSRSRYRLSTGV